MTPHSAPMSTPFPALRCRALRRALAVVALLVATTAHAGVPWEDARQMVVVVPPDWDAHAGELHLFERGTDGWRQVGDAQDVQLGRAGSAWGLGLHPVPRGETAPYKREGDGRSPAGVFDVGEAFGYAATAETRLPYHAMQASDWCIDVPGSPLYNTIVDAATVGDEAVEGSTEPMRRDLHADGDHRYEQGLVVRHNPLNRDRAGSCIFVHVWKAADVPTAGCTALPAPHMRALLAWLDPARSPVFVLLPAAAYTRLQAPWHLPPLPPRRTDLPQGAAE